MPAIGASGVLGIALETVSGTYLAPTKFIPFESESLTYQQDTNWRRPIRNTPGVVGAVAGNAHIEGDIELEALTDVVTLFLYASRCTVVKTGTGPYVYTFTPAANAIPTKTLSVSVRRNNEVFGYTGCVVSSFTISVDDSGSLKFSVSLLGTNEASAAALSSITWPTTVPYGAGQYNIQIPTATQVFDTDKFEFQSEDNGEVQYRLRNTTGAQFISFGESNATIKVERDFETRADYDTYKALTSQSVTFTATKGASESLVILMPAAIKDSYEVSLGGQGDLVRASIGYIGVIDGTGKHYQITTTCADNIV
jgi:hypothetical protein